MTMDNPLEAEWAHKDVSDAGTAFESCILGLDHVAIAVRNLDQAVHWYTSRLGFQMLETRVTKGARTSMVSAVMKAGSAVVVLVQGYEPDCQVSQFVERFDEGVQHVAFSVTDIHLAVKELEQAGASAETGILEDEGIRQAFLRRDAGSGVRIELIERRGGRFSDASVERLFRSMEMRGLV